MLRSLFVIFISTVVLAAQSVAMIPLPFDPGVNQFGLYGIYCFSKNNDCLVPTELKYFGLGTCNGPDVDGRVSDAVQLITSDGKQWIKRIAVSKSDYESRFSWYPSAYVISAEGQPIGYRLGKISLKRDEKGFLKDTFEPYFEEMYFEPGAPPHLKVEAEDDRTVVWEIGPALSSQHQYSLDAGNTWLNMGSKSDLEIGYYVFKDEEVRVNPHPMIKFVAYHRMRRYVKYYTFGKGYHDAPEEAPAMPVASSGKPGAQAKKPSKPAPPKGR